MDINELNKTQLVLLTLLITFVVSIATGIVTVSLMQQAPKSVPQLVNNVIERTIEKVNTPTAATTDDSTSDVQAPSLLGANDSAVVSVYQKSTAITSSTVPGNTPQALGQGVIISEDGLVLVDSSILTADTVYTVTLDTTNFDATAIKKFNNGFTILKLSAQDSTAASSVTPPADTSTLAPSAQ